MPVPASPTPASKEETVAVLAQHATSGGWTPAEMAFAGGIAILVLLLSYALFEWGVVLLRRVQQKTMGVERAKLLFGLPSLAVSLLPAIVVALTVRMRPNGLDLDMFSAASFVLSALVAGTLIQAVALTTFFRKVEQEKAAQSATPTETVSTETGTRAAP